MRPKTERQGRLDDTAAPALCFWVCFLREEGVGRLLQFFSLLTVGLLVCIDQLIKIIIKLWCYLLFDIVDCDIENSILAA